MCLAYVLITLLCVLLEMHTIVTLFGILKVGEESSTTTTETRYSIGLSPKDRYGRQV